jgi:hypothetical protein
MKLLTLNTHSIISDSYERNIDTFVNAIIKHAPDVIALQEVMQPYDGKIADLSDGLKYVGEITTYDKNGNSKTSGIIASGDIINIKTINEERKYQIVIYGDANSDGKINSADYIAIKNHIMDVTKLNDIEQLYADANKDGKVNSADYIAIKNHIMEVKSIVQ